jgi:hypothetical protein
MTFGACMPLLAIMNINKFIRPSVVVRQASFGAGEIPSEAISGKRQSVKGSLTKQ